MPRAPQWPKEYITPPTQTPVVREHREHRRHFLWEIVETALLTLIVFVMVRSVLLNFKVDGHSMVPTLQDGQYLLINRLSYASLDADLVRRVWPTAVFPGVERLYFFQAPQRGDIIVFWPPGASSRPFIKRIIGLPGEVVEVREGRVYVNERPLNEPYIAGRPSYTSAPIRVPLGQYYVLGDNRNNSSDSHVFGVLPADQIIGQAWLSYWPVQSWGMLVRPSYTAAELPTGVRPDLAVAGREVTVYN